MPSPDSNEPIELFPLDHFAAAEIAVAARNALLTDAGLEKDPRMPEIHRALEGMGTLNLLGNLRDKLETLPEPDLLAVSDIIRTTIQYVVLVGRVRIPQESEQAIHSFMVVMARVARRYNQGG